MESPAASISTPKNDLGMENVNNVEHDGNVRSAINKDVGEHGRVVKDVGTESELNLDQSHVKGKISSSPVQLKQRSTTTCEEPAMESIEKQSDLRQEVRTVQAEKEEGCEREEAVKDRVGEERGVGKKAVGEEEGMEGEAGEREGLVDGQTGVEAGREAGGEGDRVGEVEGNWHCLEERDYGIHGCGEGGYGCVQCGVINGNSCTGSPNGEIEAVCGRNCCNVHRNMQIRFYPSSLVSRDVDEVYCDHGEEAVEGEGEAMDEGGCKGRMYHPRNSGRAGYVVDNPYRKVYLSKREREKSPEKGETWNGLKPYEDDPYASDPEEWDRGAASKDVAGKEGGQGGGEHQSSKKAKEGGRKRGEGGGRRGSGSAQKKGGTPQGKSKRTKTLVGLYEDEEPKRKRLKVPDEEECEEKANIEPQLYSFLSDSGEWGKLRWKGKVHQGFCNLLRTMHKERPENLSELRNFITGTRALPVEKLHTVNNATLQVFVSILGDKPAKYEYTKEYLLESYVRLQPWNYIGPNPESPNLKSSKSPANSKSSKERNDGSHPSETSKKKGESTDALALVPWGKPIEEIPVTGESCDEAGILTGEVAVTAEGRDQGAVVRGGVGSTERGEGGSRVREADGEGEGAGAGEGEAAREGVGEGAGDGGGGRVGEAVGEGVGKGEGEVKGSVKRERKRKRSSGTSRRRGRGTRKVRGSGTGKRKGKGVSNEETGPNVGMEVGGEAATVDSEKVGVQEGAPLSQKPQVLKTSEIVKEPTSRRQEVEGGSDEGMGMELILHPVKMEAREKTIANLGSDVSPENMISSAVGSGRGKEGSLSEAEVADFCLPFAMETAALQEIAGTLTVVPICEEKDIVEAPSVTESVKDGPDLKKKLAKAVQSASPRTPFKPHELPTFGSVHTMRTRRSGTLTHIGLLSPPSRRKLSKEAVNDGQMNGVSGKGGPEEALVGEREEKEVGKGVGVGEAGEGAVAGESAAVGWETIAVVVVPQSHLAHEGSQVEATDLKRSKSSRNSRNSRTPRSSKKRRKSRNAKNAKEVVEFASEGKADGGLEGKDEGGENQAGKVEGELVKGRSLDVVSGLRSEGEQQEKEKEFLEASEGDREDGWENEASGKVDFLQVLSLRAVGRANQWAVKERGKSVQEERSAEAAKEAAELALRNAKEALKEAESAAERAKGQLQSIERGRKERVERVGELVKECREADTLYGRLVEDLAGLQGDSSRQGMALQRAAFKAMGEAFDTKEQKLAALKQLIREWK